MHMDKILRKLYHVRLNTKSDNVSSQICDCFYYCLYNKCARSLFLSKSGYNISTLKTTGI